MKEKLSICLLGAEPSNGNLGVRALAASLVTALERIWPGIEITFLCGGQAGCFRQVVFVGSGYKTLTVQNYRLSPRAKWSQHLVITLLAAVLYRTVPVVVVRRWLLSACPILRHVVGAAFVGDIRGGDSFSDIYGLRRFVCGSLPALLALTAGKELVLWPQTYGPFKSRLAKLLARYILRRSKAVLARDQESLSLANRFLDPRSKSPKAQICPDVAFNLEPLMPEHPAIEPPLPAAADYKLIGFNINGLLYHGGYNQKNMFGLRDNYQEIVLRVAGLLLSLPDTRILLLPHMQKFDEWNVESDHFACGHLFSRLDRSLQSRVHLAAGSYNQHQIKAVIGLCDFFIGSRMHSCIAALSQMVPTIGIAYSRKFKGVFDTLGMPEIALDATRLSQEQIVSSIASTYQRAEDMRLELQHRLPNIINQTHHCFAGLLGIQIARTQPDLMQMKMQISV